ncbi:MAG TPA: DUF3606 domain-containing protein [Casimicrobiaceae bacterium]|nr:DUF3606 domain-containing protein [Casimicrobiaceae bacterium]
MADNPGIRGQQDRSRINMSQEHEVRYWSEKLGITPDELKKAVEQVGPMADAVEQRVRGRGNRS